MPRTAPYTLACALIMGVAAPLSGTEAGPPADAQTSPDPARLEALTRCRAGLLDVEGRPAERRRWAEQLFSYDSPEATALAVELLTLNDRPAVQRALCDVVVDLARKRPARLEPAFVPPLVDLLGTDVDDLRSAAARALAGFPDSGVPERLGALAADDNAPIRARLAAVDALTPNTHRRDVVEQLIRLLDVDNDEITLRVTEALDSASDEPYGLDVQRWRQWWQTKKSLTKEAWLADQIQIVRTRLTSLQDALDSCRVDAEARQSAVTQRLRGFQRDVYRSYSAAQKEAALVEWLRDPLLEVQATALDIIKAQIADEGRRPEGEVATALRALLESESATMRREVVRVLQNLSGPDVVRDVLAQLEVEQDPATRHAILKALGKLNDPSAAPALIREIASAQSPPECVREAAIALGQIMPKAEDDGPMDSAVAALKARYASTPQQDHSLRAALLTAMAGAASTACTEEFLAAIESDDATLVRPAIDGLSAAGDTSKNTRIRDLAAHPDPMVRLAAIEALGRLGREEADLERLLLHLSPASEGNELVRQAAWRAFNEFQRRKPVAERVQAAQRLRDLPELEIAYLTELRTEIAGGNGGATHLRPVLRRLADLLVQRGSYAEACAPLRDLYQLEADGSESHAVDTGMEWLSAALHAFPQAQPGDVIAQLLSGSDKAGTAGRIVQTVDRYFASDAPSTAPDRAKQLIDHLGNVDAGLLPPEWSALLAGLAAPREPGQAEPPPTEGTP